MIPRDRTCWYCERGQHAKCFSDRLCACRECAAARHAYRTQYPEAD